MLFEWEGSMIILPKLTMLSGWILRSSVHRKQLWRGSCKDNENWNLIKRIGK